MLTPKYFSKLTILLLIGTIPFYQLLAEEEIVAGEQATQVVNEGEEPGKGGGLAGKLSISGFIDFGFFMAQNGGRGFVKDVNNKSGRAGDAAGVFLGDYGSTYVNSRHEAADFGSTASFMPDPINSDGNPSFLLNELYLNFVGDVSDQWRAQAGVSVRPRSNTFQGNANVIYLDTAFIDYKPFSKYDVALTAGKFDSVQGIEYRWRLAPDRWTVTPSLLGRYTDGTPTGIKARGKHFDKRFIYNVSLTNGSNFIDSTMLSETGADSNQFKTVSARLSYDFRFGPISLLELGASGEYGAQSHQPSNDPKQSIRGGDIQFAFKNLSFRGQFLWLEVLGGGPNEAKRYEGHAYYGEVMYGVPGLFGLNRFAGYARVGRRDVDEFDSKYIFVVDIIRITPGLRIDITESVILKAEYVVNLEMASIGSFNNDVFTSSLVVKF